VGSIRSSTSPRRPVRIRPAVIAGARGPSPARRVRGGIVPRAAPRPARPSKTALGLCLQTRGFIPVDNAGEYLGRLPSVAQRGSVCHSRIGVEQNAPDVIILDSGVRNILLPPTCPRRYPLRRHRTRAHECTRQRAHRSTGTPVRRTTYASLGPLRTNAKIGRRPFRRGWRGSHGFRPWTPGGIGLRGRGARGRGRVRPRAARSASLPDLRRASEVLPQPAATGASSRRC